MRLKVTARTEITKFDPKKISKRIAGTQGLMKAYEKAGDLDGFIKALDEHIKATKEFVEGYKKRFHAGGDMKSDHSDTDVRMKAEAFLRQYHINLKTISRWLKLSDPKYAADYRQKKIQSLKRLILALQKDKLKRNRVRIFDSVDGLIRGDFYELSKQLPDNSVDLIFTDPPYGEKGIELYEKAAEVAARVLIEGGSFVSYVGQTRLPEIIEAVGKHLRFWWICACIHSGNQATRMFEYGVICKWKPIIWFVKETRRDKETFITDVVSGGQEKDNDSWQQSQSEAEHFIDLLCPQDGLVVDFFAGSGTTLKAAHKLGRQTIGYDL